VSELMERGVFCVGLSDDINTCMAIMTLQRIRHLPVLDEGGVVGVISIGDVVKETISDQKFTIRELKNTLLEATARRSKRIRGMPFTS